MQSTSSRVFTKRARSVLLRPIAAITLLLLAVQFLIGMLVNLFVTVPTIHPGANAPEYFSGVVQGVLWVLGHGDLWLLLHAITGLLLFLASLILMVLAIMARRRAWIITSILGFLGVVAAGFNGASFLNYGHNLSSLLMSIGFLVAVIPYAIGFYITR